MWIKVSGTFNDSTGTRWIPSVWRVIKTLSAPCSLGYLGMNVWPLLFNIVYPQRNALSPSLFEICYPFKIDGPFLVPQVLVYCLYDAFIASILCTTKIGFQFLNPHSVAAVIATCNMWAEALSCKSRTLRVSFPRLFHAIFWRSRLNSPVLYAPFILRPCSRSPLDYPKIFRSSPSLLNEPS